MSTSHLDPKFCFRLLVVTLFVAGASLWWFSDIALAEQTQQELYPNPEAERWVLEQVEAGKVADLKERFPDKKDRVLSADFIEKLLTGEFEDAPVHRRGVRIKHALFTEPLDLVNAEVRCETRLDYSRFENKVDLSWSHFHRVLSFEHSKFNNAEEEVDFFRMTVGGTAFFDEAVFAGPVDFCYAQIDGNFEANGAKFNNSDNVANFGHMTVGDAALFKEAVFAGPVDFRYAQIDGNFEADGAKFNNSDNVANFGQMTVGNTAVFNETVFEGPVYFRDAQIGNNFDADGAKFNNPDNVAYFDQMTVGNTAFFNETVFAGPVDFCYAQIGNNFQAYDAKFNNPDKAANFDQMTVGNTAFFNGAVFAGPVDFCYAQIEGSFEAYDAKFNNPDKAANFGHMTVGNTAIFNGTVFAGPVDFRYAQIEGSFEANGAKFNNSDKAANFVRMTVGNTAFFNDAVFAGPVDFRDAEFIILHIQNTSWPAESESVILIGMTYKHINAGPEKGTWRKKILAWVDGSKYSGQPYVQLEEFFRAAGYPERADRVFIARKQRERSEALEGLTAWLWDQFLDNFVGYGRKPERVLVWSVLVVLLGALPFRRREYMEPQKREYASRPYNPFWYSLDLFLPFVDLRMAKVWMPMQDRRFARQYARVQIILGWILIPIGLAAIMGIIQ